MATKKQSLRAHGRSFTGVVVSDKMQKTATIEWPRRKFIPKFERFLSARTRVKAHNPEEINAVNGDIVKIVECRPISKTKHFIIVEKLGHERLFEAKEELKEEAKILKKKKEKKIEKVEEVGAENESS